MSDPNFFYYDAHCHLIADDTERYPRNPLALPGGVSSIPPGVAGRPGGHSGPNPHKAAPERERMLGWMREENVAAIAAVQKSMVYQNDNRYIIDCGEVYPDIMQAVIAIEPEDPETHRLIREAAARGVVGIRFFGRPGHRSAEWLGSDAAKAVWALAGELGLVVDVEAPMRESRLLIPLMAGIAASFPTVKVALDHVFMPDTSLPHLGLNEDYQPFIDCPNVNYKYTTLNMDMNRERGANSAEVLRRAVDLLGADRIMWGSDIGTTSGTYKEMLERARDAASLLTDAEKKAVLHDTGKRVFGRKK